MRHLHTLLKILAFCLCFSATASRTLAEPDDADSNRKPVGKTGDSSMQDVQDDMQSAIIDMISTGITIFSGVAAGLQEGSDKLQNQLDAADGTRLVANKKDLAELVQVTVYKLEEQGNGAWRITLAIRNNNAFPVRLVNLARKQSVLMLDAEGFAYAPVPREGAARTLTVAARTAAKAVFDFTGLDARPGLIRLFDTDFPVK
jgi:hypothetical protein